MKQLSKPAWFIVFFVLGVILAFILASVIHAQTRVATATWDPVTTNINGGLISSVTYNLYRGIKADGSDLLPVNLAPITTTTFVDTTISVSGKYFYSVTAVYQGNESDRSPLVPFSKGDVIPVFPPNLRAH